MGVILMPQEQNGLKKISGIGVVAAFGLITMSSSIASQSLTTLNIRPDCYEAHNYSLANNTVCNSSLLSRQAIGDIISVDKKADFVQQHEKINVNLQITKISRHISSFDFEEEFEEI